MGMGMQRWISNMKPRKFLGKRSKPDGGGMKPHFEQDINDYYHLKENKLQNLLQKKYAAKDKQKIKDQFEAEEQKNTKNNWLSLVISIVVVASIFFYLGFKLDWF